MGEASSKLKKRNKSLALDRKNKVKVNYYNLNLVENLIMIKRRLHNCELDLIKFPDNNSIKGKINSYKEQLNKLQSELEIINKNNETKNNSSDMKGGEQMVKEKKVKKEKVKKVKRDKKDKSSENINVPRKMLKRFLSSQGLHVKPEAIDKFEMMFRDWALGISMIVSKNAEENKRKTIFADDLDMLVSVEKQETEKIIEEDEKKENESEEESEEEEEEEEDVEAKEETSED